MRDYRLDNEQGGDLEPEVGKGYDSFSLANVCMHVAGDG